MPFLELLQMLTLILNAAYKTRHCLALLPVTHFPATIVAISYAIIRHVKVIGVIPNFS